MASTDQGSHEDAADVLVVGAGPTGLVLAAQLAAFGVSALVVDGKAHPVAESRALALQPRTLEVLRGSVTRRLVERGNPAVRLQWHSGDRTASLPLFDMGMEDTAYPYLLFLSQAETEQVLVEHLADQDLEVHWNTRLVGYSAQVDGSLQCDLVGPTGQHRSVRARYLVGCDGAHSTVRERAGIAFTGGRYPETFLLADADAEGLEEDSAHVWFGPNGPLFFFPLRHPATWRLLTPRPNGAGKERPPGPPGPEQSNDAHPVALEELTSVVEAGTAGVVRLADPVWCTAFQLQHRQADTYRDGRVFLAGDAAHIHSPAGAQGMNTGIQDAVNLGWKLALVCRGVSPERLLDTYDVERRPVGAFVLRFTDRAFTAATSTSPLVRFVRTHLAPRGLVVAGRLPRARAVVFRTVSQLGVRYPDTLGAARHSHSPGAGTSGAARVRRWVARVPHPRPGERLPDLRVGEEENQGWFLDTLTEPAFHLLLCGAADAWDEPVLDTMRGQYGDLLRVHRLPEVTRQMAARWGVGGSAVLLVRPDGHVADRCEDTDLSGATNLLDRWLG